MLAGSVCERARPLCTVIIPTRCRPQLLRECIRSIGVVDYPSERVEVIVVGDGAAVDARTLRGLHDGLEISILHTRALGPAAARNAGSRHAAGTILAFTDDDCRVAPGWLGTLSSELERVPRGAAGGHTVNELRDNRWSASSQRVIDLVYAYYNADPAHATFLTTNNLAVNAEAFREVGGFDESFRFAEDRDFCRRWLGRGLAITYIREALVYHRHTLTLGSFLKQHFDYGRGAFRFHRRALDARDAQFRTLLDFYSSMPRLLSELEDGASSGNRSRAVGVTADLALWQAANAAGIVWEAARSVAGKPE